MASAYVDLPLQGGGGGAVDSVNGQVGTVVITYGSLGPIPGTTGTANTFAGYDNAGDLNPIPGFTIDTNSGGMIEYLIEQPNNVGGYSSLNSISINFDPLQNSPTDSWNLNNISANFDINSSGFSQGTSGEALTLQNLTISHLGTGNIGGVSLTKNYFNLGNGTDPITVNGMTYSYGFGDVNSGVTMLGSIQGYGFQPNIHAGATLSQYATAFYDNSNINVESKGHTSFNAGPNILSVANNSNYIGLTVGPQITTFTGNSGFTGVGIFPAITTMDSGGVTGVSISPNVGTITGTGGFNGVSVNPTIGLNNNYAVGIDVNMDNVTNYPGAVASLVVQDITITLLVPGSDGNNITVEYTNTTTAGNEVCTFTYPNIVVSIQSGVSTATQVLAAFNANPTLISNASIVITGVASNPQVTYAQTNLAGGINPGTKKAAQFKGDVSIDGALSFTGGLSIGALSSFASVDISGYPSGVNSIDTLITSPTVGNNITLSTDVLAVNTAMLLTVGTNSTLTSSFLGYTALGLPAVVSMGTGSTIDLVTGATFAISLDSAATGGTIAEVDLCRALAIPNGATAVTKLVGYKMDLPFGDPGTTTWGVYITPAVHNYMAGDLKVGGTDTPTNASVGIELESTTKAILMSRMTTTEKNALTAVAGMAVFDTTLNQLSYYNGTVWVNV